MITVTTLPQISLAAYGNYAFPDLFLTLSLSLKVALRWERVVSLYAALYI